MKLDDLYPHDPARREIAVLRFRRRVDDSAGPDGCWPWTGHRFQQGYGAIYVSFGLNQGRALKAHRVAYMLHHGEVSDDLRVCHSCDNPPCCNPAHLWLGTDLDNARDSVEKGRRWSAQGPGQRNSNAKLDDVAVATIRAEYRPGVVTQKMLGERFRVSPGTIGAVVRGTNWGARAERVAVKVGNRWTEAGAS